MRDLDWIKKSNARKASEDICPSRDMAQPHIFENGRCVLCLKNNACESCDILAAALLTIQEERDAVAEGGDPSHSADSFDDWAADVAEKALAESRHGAKDLSFARTATETSASEVVAQLIADGTGIEDETECAHQWARKTGFLVCVLCGDER